MSKYIILNDGLVAGVRYTPANNTVSVNDNFTIPETGSVFIDTYKSYLIKVVMAKYQDIFNSLQKQYSAYEVESFVDQRNEWKAWKADETTATPIVDTLATAREITKEELMAKIEANVLAIVQLQGAQNALEDKIKACTTIEMLQELEAQNDL